ncbi:unnamed protein product [Gadus morhua 'NCC']
MDDSDLFVFTLRWNEHSDASIPCGPQFLRHHKSLRGGVSNRRLALYGVAALALGAGSGELAGGSDRPSQRPPTNKCPERRGGGGGIRRPPIEALEGSSESLSVMQSRLWVLSPSLSPALESRDGTDGRRNGSHIRGRRGKP